ncbi:MAG: PD-(D/E)XK nuclease family protein [Oscillospiraceae bacterium]|nr:PD-(D/E)XK nuclease family protein [Oscillospiraceae bacterium]
MEVEKLNQLLVDFSKLPKLNIPEKTFFDVSGYPHYENVCSNILQFFFDVSEQHGMKDLFLKSLFCILPEDKRFDTDFAETFVRREYSNIDILIETDEYYIIIENKVFSGLHNDLSKYLADIKQKRKDESNEHKEIIPIVLSIRRDLKDEERVEINKSNFIHVTYSDFFDRIRSNLGGYIELSNGEWLVFLKNFISNMSSLGGDNRMSNSNLNEVIRVFDDNYEIYFEFERKRREVSKFLSREAETVLDVLKAEFKYEFMSANDSHWLACSTYTKSPIKTMFDTFEVQRVLKGWEILLRVGRAHDINTTNSWLKNKGISNLKSESIIPQKWKHITLWTCKTDDNPGVTPRVVSEKAIELIKNIWAETL